MSSSKLFHRRRSPRRSFRSDRLRDALAVVRIGLVEVHVLNQFQIRRLDHPIVKSFRAQIAESRKCSCAHFSEDTGFSATRFA
jgi:hypothetical protein